MAAYFAKDKEYAIVQKEPHLLVDCEEEGTLCLVDTGFNGTKETIPPTESFDGAAVNKKVVWIGSKYLKNRGNVLDINYTRGTFRITNNIQPSQRQVPFTASSSCSGMSRFTCSLGPIVAIPVEVHQGNKSYDANAFLDTGSPHSIVLRSLLHKNQFKTLEIEECKSEIGTIDVTIDHQQLKFKPRDLALHFKTSTGVVPTNARSMMLACGLTDRVPSETYNDKLGAVDLTPHVQVTVGNDALVGFGRTQIDYDKRIMHLGEGAPREPLELAQLAHYPMLPRMPLAQIAAIITLFYLVRDKKTLAYAAALIIIFGMF